MAGVPFAGNKFPGAPSPSRWRCPRRRGARGRRLLLVLRSSRSGVPLLLRGRGFRVPFAGRHGDGVGRPSGILFLRFRLPLSGGCSVVGERPVGFVQEFWPEFGVVRRLLLRSAAEAWVACRWMIWRCWCWVWRKRWPCHARSSFQIPSISAGGSRLQPWRLFLPQVLWCSALFFAGVAAKIEWQACVLVRSVLHPLDALSFVDFGLYGVTVLRRLYPFLC